MKQTFSDRVQVFQLQFKKHCTRSEDARSLLLINNGEIRHIGPIHKQKDHQSVNLLCGHIFQQTEVRSLALHNKLTTQH